MPADFLANDFGAIARAMRREASAARKVVLHMRRLTTVLTSDHESIEDAVAKAYAFWSTGKAIPNYIAAADGTVLMDRKALAEAMARYREGLPI